MDGITDSTDMNLGKLWETVKNREAWDAPFQGGRSELDTTERQNNRKAATLEGWGRVLG